MKTAILKTKNNPLTFYIMASGIFVCLAFYMYCINAAVRSGVAMNMADRQISTLQNNLTDLESKYMEAMNTITPESAASLGLNEPQNKVFISKSSGSLSYVNN